MMLLSLVVLVVMAAVGVVSIDSPNPSNGLESDMLEMKRQIKELREKLILSENADAAKSSGGWSQWTRWYTCTVTCGGGVQIRERKCDSPVPTTAAGNCVGASHETKPCNSYACPAPEIVRDGGWGEWGIWDKCSVSCGGGRKVRDRKCDNPPPNHRGRGCVGAYNEFDVCGSEACPALGSDVVAFCVGLKKDFEGYSDVTFDKAVYNIGGYYQFGTNAFIAPYKGVYSFSYSGGNYEKAKWLWLSFWVGDKKLVVLDDSTRFDKNSGVRYQSQSIIVSMEKDDRAYIYQIGPGSLTSPTFTSFCGMLMQRLE